MLSLEKNTIPRLGISNVTLEKDLINVSGFVTGSPQLIRNYSKLHGELLKYLKIYFIISAPKTYGDIRNIPAKILTSPGNRVTNIAAYLGLKGMNSMGWFKEAKNSYYTTSLSLESVLGKRRSITLAELSPNSTLEDANFNIDIPIEERLYLRNDVEHVMLHSFIQFDSTKYLEDGNATKFTQSLVSFLTQGGNLKSKKILELRDGVLKNPEFRQILTLEDGTPFNGNYTTLNGVMVDSKSKKELVVKNIREKEISANYFIEKLALPSGNKPREQTSKELEYSYTKPLTDFSKSDLRLERDTTLAYQDRYVALASENISKEKLTNAQTSYITNSAHSISSQDASHNIIFDLHWEKIIKDKTKYGSFISIVNKNRHLQNLITIAGAETKNFNVENILRNYSIKELIIKRSKLKNDQITTNPVGSLKKTIIEEEEVLVRIPNFSFITGYSDNRISLHTATNRLSKKTLLLKDKDLFFANNKSSYSYKIELIIDEQTSKYFQELIQGFKEAISSFDQAMYRLNNQKSLGLYVKNKDKLQANSSAPPSIKNIGNIIDMYMMMLCWADHQFSTEEFLETRTNIFTMASHDHGGTISGLYKFRELCEVMLYDLEGMLEKIDRSTIGLVTGARKSTREPPIQKLQLNIPGFSTAIPQGGILVSYSTMLATEGGRTFITSEPNTYSYKTTTGLKKILSKSELTGEKDLIKKENKLLRLENALKTSKEGHLIQMDINTEEPKIKTEELFGIPGISLAIPSSKGVFVSNDKLTKNVSVAAEQDITSNLSKSMKDSIAQSTIKKTEIKKLTDQEMIKEDEMINKRNGTSRQVIKMLSGIENHEPMHKIGSTAKRNDFTANNLMETLFKKKRLEVGIQIMNDSAEMEFGSISAESFSMIAGDNVLLKISEPFSQTEKEQYQYQLIDNIYSTSKESIRKLLNEIR